MKKNITLLFPASFFTFKGNWKEAWLFPSFRTQTIFTLTFLAFLGVFITPFFAYIQSAPGFVINDPILNRLPVQDFSVSIFLLIYSVIILTVVNISTYPIIFLKCIQAYCLLVTIRIFCLYMVPLNPEGLMIPLNDPFVGRLFYNGTVITKDLFFSGHVSTMFLFFLVIPFRSLKYYFLTATILVSIFILIQHVHYSIDVMAAPFVSYVSYRIVQHIPCRIS